MRHEYQIDRIMEPVFDLSFCSDVPVASILDGLSPAVLDENELDYINKNWDVKSYRDSNWDAKNER